jgi:HK97 family phage major capsid protein
MAAPAAGSEEESARALEAATREPGRQASPEENKALKAFLQRRPDALTPEQRKRMFARVNPDIRAAMSTTTTTEGGYTTALEYQRSVEQALKALRRHALGRRPSSRPPPACSCSSRPATRRGSRRNRGPERGRRALDTAFGLVTLDVYKYSSKKIALPFELLQDSFIDIEAYIREVLQMRLGPHPEHALHHRHRHRPAEGRGHRATSGKVGTTGQTSR